MSFARSGDAATEPAPKDPAPSGEIVLRRDDRIGDLVTHAGGKRMTNGRGETICARNAGARCRVCSTCLELMHPKTGPR